LIRVAITAAFEARPDQALKPGRWFELPAGVGEQPQLRSDYNSFMILK
jgi:hypothetical protein